MRERSDADRREALSRVMRSPSESGKRSAGTPQRQYGVFVLFIMAVIVFAGILLWQRYFGGADGISVEVSDESAKQEEQGQEQVTERQPYIIPEYIRVLLMNSDYSSIYHDTVTIAATGGEIEITAESLMNAFSELQMRMQQEGLQIEKREKGYLIERKAGAEDAAYDKIGISSISRVCGTPSYRGSLYLYVWEGKLVLVNELKLEEYLYGVLPSEMPADYHEEALKAQAVCARTFACASMESPRYPAYEAHMDDSTSCQVYGNLAEHENTTRAVDATRGEILCFDKRPVSTYYYSTSSGLSGDIGVWQGYEADDFPYLSCRSLNAAHESVNLSDNTEFASYLAEKHDDFEEEHPWYRWSCTVAGIDADLIYEKLKERYLVKQEGIELVTDAAAGEAADGETGTEGELPHPGAIRNLYIAQRNASGCAVCLYIEGENCSYYVWGEYNIRYLLCDGNTTVIRQDGSEVTMNRILPSAYLILTPSLDKGLVIGYSISGGGYGHGVGMSQNGADAMAADGKDYREILGYYYIGTSLTSQE